MSERRFTRHTWNKAAWLRHRRGAASRAIAPEAGIPPAPVMGGGRSGA